MKLLMISGDRTVAQGRAGAFSTMLEEFQTRWDRIDVLCPYVGSGPLVTRLGEKVFLHPSPWRSLLLRPRWISKKGKELFETHHHDIMTVHDYPPFLNGFGTRKLERLTEIPAVLEIHHVIGWPVAASFSEQLGYLMSRAMLRSHAKHFRAVRVVNGEAKELLVSWGIPKNVLHIVPSFYLDHEIARSAQGTEKKWDVVCSGRLVPNKGLSEVLEAVSKLSSISLLVIGDGPERAALEAKAKALGISSRVNFTGWLPSLKDVAQGIASGKVFVMNSKSEGGPRAALEAMSYGVPVLSTKVGVMPEVISDGDNGLFTDGTVEDLALKIDMLLKDEKKRESMGREAAKILEKFEKKRLVQRYADFLKGVAMNV